jgi:hypothetical protein
MAGDFESVGTAHAQGGPRTLRRAGGRATSGAVLALCLLAFSGACASAMAAGGTVTRTYSTEGTQGTFVVPAGVEAIDVAAVGGAGASSLSATGGLGARVEGELSVTPGSTLYVEVGAKGDQTARGAGVGGGSSDVRTASRAAGLAPEDRLIVAGGGGGAGAEGLKGGEAGDGGNAGGEEGQHGENVFDAEGGEGGTQTEGGFRGEEFGRAEECLRPPVSATDGRRETGGRGEACPTKQTAEGGGGGEGYFGGGGGGAGLEDGAGGGGGSSLVPVGGSERLAEGEGPQVQISYAQPANPPAVVTAAASELRRETAIVHAIVNPEDEEVTGCEFEWGTTASYGYSVPCSSNPGAGVAPVEVSAQVAGLSDEATYHFRIVATNANGTSYGGDATFTTPLHNPPAVTGVSPEAGPQAGGETVTISGSEFDGVTSVTFGSTPAESFTVDSSESITAVTPAGTGAVSVLVTTPEGTSSAGGTQFAFLPLPVVTGVSPKKGPGTGGTSVTIEGSGFDSASTVSFGASAASSVTFNSATSITAVSPPGEGTVEVTVTTPYAGTSATTKHDRFKYKKVKIKK